MKAVLVTVALLALTACAVGPNFKPPQSPATDRYTAADLPLSLAGGADIPYQWWRSTAARP